MKTRRCGNKPKRFIKGITLPIVYLICSLTILGCLFMPVISGGVNLNAPQVMGGIFDFPLNPLNRWLGSEGEGAYYNEFIKDAFLSITSPYFNDLYRYFATLLLPLVLMLIVLVTVFTLIKSIKEIIDTRSRASLKLLYLIIFGLSVFAILLIPGLNIDDYAEIDEILMNYILFLETYTIGIGLIVIAATSFIMTFFTIFIRLCKRIFTGRGAILE